MDFGVLQRVAETALPAVVCIEMAAVLYLMALYQEPARWLKRRPAAFEFSLAELGGQNTFQLLLVSIAGLFLEVLMIRWVSSEIRIFAFFKNFVLIACYFGFGLGCYFCRRRINILAMAIPTLLLVLLVQLPYQSLRQLVDMLPTLIGSTSGVTLWGVPDLPLDGFSLLLMAAAVVVVIPLFALIAFVFVPIGQMVGGYLEAATQGIRGYTVNIVGSLLGVALYTALCFLDQPPATWFAVAAILLMGLLWRHAGSRWTVLGTFAVSIGLLLIPLGGERQLWWSPYQKLTVAPVRIGNEIASYQLTTNGSWYQQILNMSPEYTKAHPDQFPNPVSWHSYNVPYLLDPDPKRVLILGAGMGNDVAAALRNSQAQVDAVEIDPLILALGKELHFEKPYDSPRTHAIVDDARSYIQNCHQQYDLIVFSLLDSHTTASHFSNVRIDNYVYTIEAMRAARKLLAPDGLFMVKFAVSTPWIAGRLRRLLTAAFEVQPLQIDLEDSSGGRFFITGAPSRLSAMATDPRLQSFITSHADALDEDASVTTDDWPYFYQHAPGVPLCVWMMSAMIVVVCWGLMRATGGSPGAIQWHFFFLGAGFLLLEAQIISKLALLFGTTWVVNSIVITVLLCLIVLSNQAVLMKPDIPVSIGYAGIFTSVLIAWFVPLQSLFFESIWLRAAAATLLLCLPVFFAGIVFIRSFAKAQFSGAALGSNLFGALCGGILESLSFWTGLKSLLLIAAVLYCASWVALRPPAPSVPK